MSSKSRQKKRQTECRTATTAYPCYLPVLGDSAGAGRTRLPNANLLKRIPIRNYNSEIRRLSKEVSRS